MTDIREAGQRLLSLVNDILDLSKMESGFEELEESRVEIAQLMSFVLSLFKERAQANRLTCELDVPEGLPRVWADERKLKQIVINLMSNAVKFTPEGGRVVLRAFRGDDGAVTLQVIDNGIGMNPESIPMALAPLHQIDGDLNRKYEGAGIGLSLAKALAELHGGRLELDSKLGEGTTVTVSLPASRVQRPSEKGPSMVA